MTGIPEEFSFIRYLAAKKDLDDRSLNRHVRETLARHLLETRKTPPLRVLEVGCGIGTMLERLLDWQLLPEAAYTGIDSNPGNIAEARARRQSSTAARGSDLTVTAEFEAIDLYDFLAREPGRAAWDLIVAHAFLDLVDLEATLPGLLALLAPGAFFYFTLNFDGATVFSPPIDPELDRLIETLYHRSMDERRVDGRPSGNSRTGRRLCAHLPAAGATLLAAGSSDWLVFPGSDGYPGDEAYFLHFIIQTIQQALEGHPELPEADFRAWIEKRHAQITQGELIYIAHQLDFFGRV